MAWVVPQEDPPEGSSSRTPKWPQMGHGVPGAPNRKFNSRDIVGDPSIPGWTQNLDLRPGPPPPSQVVLSGLSGLGSIVLICGACFLSHGLVRGRAHFTSPHFTSFRFTSLHACAEVRTSLHLIPFHFTSLVRGSAHFILLHFTSLHFTSLHFASLARGCAHFTSLHFISLYLTSLHFTPLHSTGARKCTIHFTSLHFISFHSTSLFFRRRSSEQL